MISSDANLPKVALSRRQWLRMIVVGILVVIALARVVPDVVRVVYPLQVFGYGTDGNGIVIRAPATPDPHPSAKPRPKGRWSRLRAILLHGGNVTVPTSDAILVGDRVRIDRIKPFDRKPGLAGNAYTYENTNRYLPIERGGKERILHLVSRAQSPANRFLDLLRLLMFVLAVGLGAILFLVKPGIATAAFFVFCLGGIDAPATYLDTIIPNPWRPIPQMLSDMIRGAVRPALLLFALCLIDGEEDAPRERIFAWFTGILALALGVLIAYGDWRENYAALPADAMLDTARSASNAVIVLTTIALGVAFARGHRNDRHRIGWIAVAFAVTGIAGLASSNLYPGRIPLWFNSLLVMTTIIPIIVVWIAVIRHQFFNVDFVVSRAVVYVALTAAVIGTISVTEEVGTYLFYQNTDLAYGILIAISMGVGSLTGKIKQFLDTIVDRFIFRDRHEQRKALEFIAGYILDAETVEDVYRALLHDAAHALKLSFGGILARQPDGGYILAANYDWPPELTIQLGPSDELTQAITRTRGALTFSGRDTRLIQESFPNERVTFAAPLFFDRIVSGIVVYGHNVSGLDLDPEERELLVRVVAHASIALNAIELARYRDPKPATTFDPVSAPLPGTG